MLFASRGRKVGPAIFDRCHRRLTQGMIGYWSPALTGPTGLQLLDLSGENNNGTLTGMDAATDWPESQIGRALDFDGTNDFVALQRAVFELPFSVSLWFRSRSATTVQNLFGIGSSASANPLFQVLLRGDLAGDPVQATMRGQTIITNTAATISGYTANTWHHVVAVFRDVSYRQIWLDGVEGTADTTTYDVANLNLATIAAQRRTTTGQYLNGQVAECVQWGRALGASEVHELLRLAPGGLGRPKRISIGIFEATIGFSILADTGSYTLTGLPIPLLYGRSIAADAASILLQGQTTPLRLSRLLGADPRSYQFSGVDAGILLGRLLDAGAAAYTVDGTSAGFVASRRISAESVAHLASGQDAAFLRSHILQAGTGQYILVASPIDIQTGTGGAAPYYYLFLLGGSC